MKHYWGGTETPLRGYWDIIGRIEVLSWEHWNIMGGRGVLRQNWRDWSTFVTFMLSMVYLNSQPAPNFWTHRSISPMGHLLSGCLSSSLFGEEQFLCVHDSFSLLHCGDKRRESNGGSRWYVFMASFCPQMASFIPDNQFHGSNR